ncbi:hypothetical protein NNC19_00610 [Clostridium sp. SHJSY1]|uniref:hypothetical protein n=1 Tax=Clostridium sp. SHJSY1 TaxID=2942483 RepID=UPI002875391A|nr:hypothetical protein [Clostridium sp. SHJSY1]MDS0524156.1 hypothetical protein [Clostridium sp. SHJSY1]
MVKRKKIKNKSELNRIMRLKKTRKKRIRALILLIAVILLSTYLLRTLYIKNKSKDLQYAVEHSLTSGDSKERLLRVDNISLIFDDNKKAIVEVSGLSKSEPHSSTKIKGTFKRGMLNSWELEESKKIENET